MEDKGYKDKKEFICTGCGCTEMATKFASQKTFLCKKCKENGSAGQSKIRRNGITEKSS